MNKSLHKNKKKKTAFSLIELSIVLAIISIIISGAITVSESAIKNAKIKVTKERIQVIEEAMASYLASNSRLPCPASLFTITTDTNYGTEQRDTGGSGNCFDGNTTPGNGYGILESSNSSADAEILYGAIPFRTLGLPTEYAGDAFNNKFSYIVLKQLTAESSNGSTGFANANLASSSIDKLVISETISNSSGTTITNLAAYLIISHGPNGLGAFNINSGANQNSAATSDELNNTVSGTTTNTDIFDATFVVNSGTADFDDITHYKLHQVLINTTPTFRALQIDCPAFTYNDPCGSTNVTFITANYGDLQNGDVECTSFGCFSDSGNDPELMINFPYARCGLNGNWEFPLEYPCYFP